MGKFFNKNKYKLGESVQILYKSQLWGGRVIEVKPKIKVRINEGPHAGTIVDAEKL